MVGVITSLKGCQLGTKKLDKLVFIMKNWPYNPRFGYSNEVQFKSMEEFLNVEDDFLEENEKFFAYFNLLKED